MKLAMIGLGKMGANMAQRIINGGHQIVAYDRSKDAIAAMVGHGAEGAHSLEDVAAKLDSPRVAWVMVPSGSPTEQTVVQLGELFSAGDIIIDGGNSNYKDSMRRGAMLAEKGVHFVDVGTSGGVWGLAEGYSMMAGGEKEPLAYLTPLLETLAPSADTGWGHVGPVGAGHFVKMVHNGIEYGLMQAYAEGFELMQQKSDFNLDMHQISEIWRYGSVVRSWLLDLTADALAENPNLDGIAAFVPDSGEGRWTVMESIDLGVPIPVISLALQQRFRSRQDAPFGAKMLSAMRNQFGGHAIKKAK